MGLAMDSYLGLLIILVVRRAISRRHRRIYLCNQGPLFFVLLGLELAGQFSALGRQCRFEVGIGFGHFSVNSAELFLGLYRH